MRRLPVKCEKPQFFGIFGHFLQKIRFSGRTKIFFGKNGRAIILKIFVPNIPENFRTIPWTVSEIKRDGRTDARTHKTDSIGPSRLKPGTNKWCILGMS